MSGSISWKSCHRRFSSSRRDLRWWRTYRPSLDALEERLAPALSIFPTPPPQGFAQVSYYQPFAIDGGSGNYDFELTTPAPAGLSLSETDDGSPLLAGTPTVSGTFSITMNVTDLDTSDEEDFTFDLIINPAATSPTLTFVENSVPAGMVGDAFDFTFHAQGGSGSFTYSLGVLVDNNDSTTAYQSEYATIASALPEGLSFDTSTGTLSGTPIESGVWVFVVQANDGAGNFGSQALSLTIGATVTVSPATLANGEIGQDYSQHVSGAGGVGPYRYAITSGQLPPGMKLDADTGELHGKPAAWGKYGFTVTATDDDGHRGSQAFTITVDHPVKFSLDGSHILVLPISTTNYYGVVDVDYVLPIVEGNGGTFDYVVTDEGNLPHDYHLERFNDGTAILSFHPDEEKDYSFTVTGFDLTGNLLPLDYYVEVRDHKHLPYGIDFGLPLATRGVFFDHEIKAEGVTSLSIVRVIDYDGDDVDLHDLGLDHDITGDRLRIHGTPTMATVGGYWSIEIEVEYQVGSETYKTRQSFSLNVTNPQTPITIGPATLPNGTQGSTYQAAIQIQGGTGPYTVTLEGSAPVAYDSSLDEYVRLTIVQPTPESPNVAMITSGDDVLDFVGQYSFVVRVQDANGVIASTVLTLNIQPPASYPRIVLNSNQPGLPNANPGVFYTQTIRAVGGSGMTTLSFPDDLADSLAPYGVGISSTANSLTISGTPTITTWATVTFDVTATDGVGNSVTQKLTFSNLFTAQQIRQAYGIDNVILPGGILGDGAGQTVVVVVGGDSPALISSTDPNFQSSDLFRYDRLMGINTFGTTGGPTFLKVDQFGGTNFPAPSTGSSGEMTQDVSWIHALAPRANIVLIVASSSSNEDFFTAFETARTFVFPNGVGRGTVISNSYGSNENSQPAGVLGFDQFFTDPSANPAAYFFAMSDPGGGAFPQYNAGNLGAIGVAQTQLVLDAQGRYAYEIAVDGIGGGPSALETQPPWQTGVVDPVSTSMRTMADVSFVGAINSAVAIYQTFGNQYHAIPWANGNGSSLATPSWAALMAIVNQGRARLGLAPLSGPEALEILYSLAGSEDFHRITQLGAGGNDLLVNDGNGYIDATTITPAFNSYNPWSGLGSPVANLLLADLVGGKNTIQGTLFHDLNANGVRNSNETALVNWLVFLDANGNRTFDAGEASTRTNNAGAYNFVVSPGGYTVVALPQAGWLPTRATAVGVNFPVAAGRVAVANFGFQRGVISGRLVVTSGRPGTALPTTLVMTFTIRGARINPATIAAAIDWGNGRSTVGRVVSLGNGTFAVVANYVYPTIGRFTIRVSLSTFGVRLGTSSVVIPSVSYARAPTVAQILAMSIVSPPLADEAADSTTDDAATDVDAAPANLDLGQPDLDSVPRGPSPDPVPTTDVLDEAFLDWQPTSTIDLASTAERGGASSSAAAAALLASAIRHGSFGRKTRRGSSSADIPATSYRH